MKTPQITLKNYNSLLSQVQIYVKKTHQNITRKKVEMAWNIGRKIEQHLQENKELEKTNYGKNLLTKLESDVGIAESVLYKMRSFYRTYPKIPRDDEKLNWTHYSILSGIKKEDDRKFLEDLTKKENLDAESLRKKIRERKTPTVPKITKLKKLVARRGKLFNYTLVQPAGVSGTCLDCGFGVFKKFDKRLFPRLKSSVKSSVKVIETVKNDKSYALKKSPTDPRKLNAYKAYLSRVVDGDTVHVILDLGFEIFHEEILRLRAINAAESGTEQGEKATRALKRILKNVPFLIVKTSGKDQHGRYVADVFLAGEEREMSEQEVADEGAFLNQLLVTKGVVELVG